MSDKTGKLSFELSFPERLGNDVLPIEVRGADRKLVGRFDASEEPAVKPGPYFVSVRLPGGEEVTDWVDVSEGGTARAVLAAEPGEEGDSMLAKQVLAPRRAAITFERISTTSEEPLISQESLARLRSRRAVDPSLPVGICAWTGTIGKLEPLDPSHVAIETRRSMTRITVPPTGCDEQCLLQLLVPNRPGLVLVAPQRPYAPCTLAVIRSGDELLLEAHLENKVADVMIRDRTEIGRTARAADQLNARGLLQAKSADPIAAAAGAVALLGIDQAGRIQSWLRKLAQDFPWLPDGAAIAAESAARRGDHREAVEMLLLLENRGIPLFSDALAWALDRLARYERSSEPLGDLRTLRSLRLRLQPFAEVGVSGRALTTFRALDPNEPDDEPCGPTLPPHVRPIENLVKGRA